MFGDVADVTAGDTPYALLLWHEEWQGGTIRLACEDSIFVDSINKHSIKGPAIVPLQRISLSLLQTLPYLQLSILGAI